MLSENMSNFLDPRAESWLRTVDLSNYIEPDGGSKDGGKGKGS